MLAINCGTLYYLTDYVPVDDLDIDDAPYTNMTFNSDSPIPRVLPIQLSDLSIHVADCHVDGFNAQFKVITGTESLFYLLLCLNRIFTQGMINQPQLVIVKKMLL